MSFCDSDTSGFAWRIDSQWGLWYLARQRTVRMDFIERLFHVSPDSDNHIYTALLRVPVGTIVAERYDHCSLLRTVEENFDLGTLGRNDATARPFSFLFGAEPVAFNWADHSQPAEEA